MKLSPPTQPVWIVAVVLGILGIVATLVAIPYLSDYSFWVMAVAWLVLVLSTMLKGV